MKTFKEILSEADKKTLPKLMTNQELVDFLNKNHLPPKNMIGETGGEKPYYDLFYKTGVYLLNIDRGPSPEYSKKSEINKSAKEMDNKWKPFRKQILNVIKKLGFKVRKDQIGGDEKGWISLEWYLEK